jgi:hypothetical protein
MVATINGSEALLWSVMMLAPRTSNLSSCGDFIIKSDRSLWRSWTRPDRLHWQVGYGCLTLSRTLIRTYRSVVQPGTHALMPQSQLLRYRNLFKFPRICCRLSAWLGGILNPSPLIRRPYSLCQYQSIPRASNYRHMVLKWVRSMVYYWVR